MRNRNTSIRYPGGRKVLWGVGAYVVGYLITLVTFGRRIDGVLEAVTVSTQNGTVTVATLVEEIEVSTTAGAGWLFYNAHLVPIALPRTDEPPVQLNLVLDAGGSTMGLLVVPPLLLVAAGVAVTWKVSSPADLRYDLGGLKTRYAFNGGVVTFLGYVPLVVLGAVVLSLSVGIRGGPDLFLAFVVGGGLYPFVFGAIGGLLGSLGAERPSMAERDMGWERSE